MQFCYGICYKTLQQFNFNAQKYIWRLKHVIISFPSCSFDYVYFTQFCGVDLHKGFKTVQYVYYFPVPNV